MNGTGRRFGPGALNVPPPPAPAAGIVVGVVAMTGLGLKFSAIVIAYAGGSLLLTTLYTSLIVWIIGLAVPVTASYIICAVIAAPALIKLGCRTTPRTCSSSTTRSCSEVSPPTALSPFAAAAHHRRRPLSHHVAVLEVHPAGVRGAVRVRARPAGPGLLLALPKGGSWVDIVEIAHLDHLRAAGAGRRSPRTGAPATKYPDRARPVAAIRIAAGVSEPDRRPLLSRSIAGRDLSYDVCTRASSSGLGVVL